jgi:hypothetical protein
MSMINKLLAGFLVLLFLLVVTGPWIWMLLERLGVVEDNSIDGSG